MESLIIQSTRGWLWSAAMALYLVLLLAAACSDDTDYKPDANCSFAKWCREIPGSPGHYSCEFDEKFNRNPCCPAIVHGVEWRGCKVGADASVIFANCGASGWVPCGSAVPDAGAGH